MTREECMKILSNKDDENYKEFKHLFRTNYNKCRKYYNDLGYKGYTLHHKIVNCNNYEEWKIDEIEPITRSEHSRLHMMYYKQGLGSRESIEKVHRTLKERYKTGEVVVWNKGHTKETDSRIHDSPRKGKTGEDFPFLRASKNGKAGGWNRGITKDDPRYESLLFTDEQKKHLSNVMKKKTEEGRNNAFIYACKDSIYINNGEKNKRIKKNLPIPDGWVKGKLNYKNKEASK